ncbi:MAG: galactose-1-phosphate uridylyltransferase [Thermodesulfovibrionales bacterium]|nr:galactose-1-phosphate uridylyltransferase [Thermodesulfovibrionales bacterium]
MPELRKDPVSGRWVIISVERGKRPTDFVSPLQKRRAGGFCPFCPGNEHTTPNEILSFRQPNTPANGPGWSLRVVPNKFPALQIHGDLNKRGVGVFDMINGIGAHEVIIETPEHLHSLSTLPLKAVEDVLWAYYFRLTDLKKDVRLKYVLIFKNEGEVAGASLEHTHSQLIALPIVPQRVREEMDNSKKYYDSKERCLICDVINQELDSSKRVVLENAHYVAIAPFASRDPFETWVLPKKHESSFAPIDKSFSSLADILQKVLKQLDKVLDTPPYNFMLHTSPFKEEQNEYYHWHIEILPRLTKRAGFEWGSGFYINPTLPEEAAKFMREAKI